MARQKADPTKAKTKPFFEFVFWNYIFFSWISKILKISQFYPSSTVESHSISAISNFWVIKAHINRVCIGFKRLRTSGSIISLFYALIKGSYHKLYVSYNFDSLSVSIIGGRDLFFGYLKRGYMLRAGKVHFFWFQEYLPQLQKFYFCSNRFLPLLICFLIYFLN